MVSKIRKIIMAITIISILIGAILILTGLIGELKLFRVILGGFFIGGGIIANIVGNDRFSGE